jgi:hypothetical protein
VHLQPDARGQALGGLRVEHPHDERPDVARTADRGHTADQRRGHLLGICQEAIALLADQRLDLLPRQVRAGMHEQLAAAEHRACIVAAGRTETVEERRERGVLLFADESLQRGTLAEHPRRRAHVLAHAPDLLARHRAGDLHTAQSLLIGESAQQPGRARRDDDDDDQHEGDVETGQQPAEVQGVRIRAQSPVERGASIPARLQLALNDRRLAP